MRRGMAGLALCLILVGLPAAEAPYYPPPGHWAHKTPAEVGMDAAKLNDAIEFMNAHETASPARDFTDQEIVNGKLLGSIPTERATTDGLIIRHGYGFLWWLNTKGRQWPGSPRTSFEARGQGGNIIHIDPSRDLVVVWRWSAQSVEGFKKIVAAIAN